MKSNPWISWVPSIKKMWYVSWEGLGSQWAVNTAGRIFQHENALYPKWWGTLRKVHYGNLDHCNLFFSLRTKQKSIISQRYVVCLPSARVFQVTRKKTMYESKHSGWRGGELKEPILPKVTGKRPEVWVMWPEFHSLRASTLVWSGWGGILCFHEGTMKVKFMHSEVMRNAPSLMSYGAIKRKLNQESDTK